MRRIFIILSTILCFTGIIPTLYAASYYSDPVGGNMTNDGSQGSPWGNLHDIFVAGKTFIAGDEIFLMDGAHGQSFITGSHTDYVTIKAMPGHTPKVAAVSLGNGSYWAFDGLVFTADGSGGAFTSGGYLFLTKRSGPGYGTTYVKVENCTFYSAESSASWSKADWYANAVDAVRIRGDYTIFNNNVIKNTMFALQIEENYAEVKNNLIDNFGGDAVRALGSHAVYEGNTIRDAYVHDYDVPVTGNHDDAIQMYPLNNGAFDPNGVFDDVVIRNNMIYNFADPITQAMIDDELVSYWMQGIINTDGRILNSVVENNLVVADHPHGITLFGPVNCRVQNNTVMKTSISINPVTTHIPWIAFWKDKNDNQPADSIMRNNIASEFTPGTHAGGSNITIGNNLEPAVSQYVNVFFDYPNFDLRLKTDSAAIDAGVNTDLTVTDLIGNPRLVGSLVDQGAYEFQLTPELIEAQDTYFNDRVVVVFDRTVTLPTAEDAGNYTLSAGASVLQASLDVDGVTVSLSTSPLTGGIIYTVTADGVEDADGHASSGTAADFQYLCNTNWASSFQDDEWGYNPPEDAFDGDLNTRWSAEGDGEWIQHNFCEELSLESVDIAFYSGFTRSYSLTIEVSSDGRTFTQVFSGSSASGTLALQNFDFADTPAKYVRIKGFGNNSNDWNNYTEIVFNTSVLLTGYEAWILDYPGVGTATNLTDNPDNDGLNNLGEWALGGNPDDPNDIGYEPIVEIIDHLGNDWIEYIYARRTDYVALGLTYQVQQNTNLVDGTWVNINPADIAPGPPGSAGPGFDSVTNWVDTTFEDSQFLRLIIETN